MKYIFLGLVVFIGWTIFLSGLFTFVNLTSDYSKWSQATRVVFVLWGPFMGLVAGILIANYHFESSKLNNRR